MNALLVENGGLALSGASRIFPDRAERNLRQGCTVELKFVNRESKIYLLI
jgi:hypothetical protein